VGELIGYARCSTILQDLTAQREILTGRVLNRGTTSTPSHAAIPEPSPNPPA